MSGTRLGRHVKRVPTITSSTGPLAWRAVVQDAAWAFTGARVGRARTQHAKSARRGRSIRSTLHRGDRGTLTIARGRATRATGDLENLAHHARPRRARSGNTVGIVARTRTRRALPVMRHSCRTTATSWAARTCMRASGHATRATFGAMELFVNLNLHGHMFLEHLPAVHQVRRRKGVQI